MTTRLLLAILVVLSLAASGCSSGRNSCLSRFHRHRHNDCCNCNRGMQMYDCGYGGGCGTCNSCPYGSCSMGGCGMDGCSSCSMGGCSSCEMGGCSSCSGGACSSCSSCGSGAYMMEGATMTPASSGIIEGPVEMQTPTPAPAN